MTLNEFLLVSTAWREQEEEHWDRTAHIMGAIINYGGLGATEPIQAEEIFNLRKHQEHTVSPITSWEEALELIDSM